MKYNIRYLLGIDDGGTKTEFLLTDSDGNEIKRIFLDTSNSVKRGCVYENMIINLRPIKNTINICRKENAE